MQPPTYSSRLRPRSLTLIVTHQCVAACEHCCFGCGPSVKSRIPGERLRGLIDEAREIASIQRITFTGGEPFLLGAELVELIARAARNGYHVTVMTSGYWAVTAVGARTRLAPLVDAGLRRISLSTGTHHAAFVPVERAIEGALAAAEFGLETSISLETFSGAAIEREQLFDDARLRPLLDDGRVTFFERPWIGHADGTLADAPLHEPRYSRFLPSRITACFYALNDLTITPGLELMACCGHPIESLPDLRMGSVADRTIAQAIEAAPHSPLLEMLRAYGPERMYQVAAGISPEIVLPLESAHPCDTCTRLQRDPLARAALDTIAKRFPEQLAAAFEDAVASGL